MRSGDLVASVSRLDPVEGVTVVDHTRLDGSRGGNAISNTRGCWPRSCPNNADANIVVNPDELTCRADFRVPRVQLSSTDAVESSNLVTSISRLNLVERVAVVDDTGLNRIRGRYAIAWSGRRWRGACGLFANNADADVVVNPERLAVGPDLGVPADELGSGDAIC